MSRSRCVVLFTKPARPGRVKTRLIGRLTARQAADLHAAFLGDLAERLGRGDFALRIAWALDGGEPVPPGPAPGFRQRGADLGRRLYAGLERAGRDFELVAAVGSDHPELPLARVEEAFALLEAGDVRPSAAIGPAADGGYYLIALRTADLDPGLFSEVPWSTGGVLEATLERCRALGLEPRLLPPGADVDDAADLERLESALAAGADLDCPRTVELLAAWRTVEARP